MTTIYAKLIGGLIHLGRDTEAHQIVSITAVHPDSFADLFGLEEYRRIQDGDVIEFEVSRCCVARRKWEGMP